MVTYLVKNGKAVKVAESKLHQIANRNTTMQELVNRYKSLPVAQKVANRFANRNAQ